MSLDLREATAARILTELCARASVPLTFTVNASTVENCRVCSAVNGTEEREAARRSHREGRHSEAPIVWLTESRQPVFTRAFRVDAEKVLRAVSTRNPEDPFLAGKGMEAIRQFFGEFAETDFTGNDYSFGWPTTGRRAFFFNDRTGVLFVRAEMEVLNRMGEAIEKMKGSPEGPKDK
jgi:hypothetical protein